MPVLRSVRRRNLDFLVIFSIEELLSPRLFITAEVSVFQLLSIRCYDAKHYNWGSILGCWHSTVFRDIISKLCHSIILFLEDRINGQIFPSEKMRIRWFFGGIDFRDFLECLKLFLPISLTLRDTVDTEIFFYVSFLIFWQGSFSKAFYGFLTSNLMSSWSRTILLGLWVFQVLFHHMYSHSGDVQLLWNISFPKACAKQTE